MQIRWGRAARRDIRGLKEYIARDSPFYARQFCERLVDAVDQLAAHPRMGREVPEAEGTPEEVRELLFRDYRILYLVEADVVHVLAIVHGARNLEGMVVKPWG